MKRIGTTLLLLFISFWTAQSTGAAESKTDKVLMKWLGTAGWEIQTGNTTILIDPFLTRRVRIRNAEWQTDEEAVRREIERANYIFAGHSHADHVGDIPFIAKRFGSKIIGSKTTTNLALMAGVDKSQVMTIRGGSGGSALPYCYLAITSDVRGSSWIP